MKKLFFFFLLFPLLGFSESETKKDKYLFGVSDFKPFVIGSGSNQKLSGFDIDYINILAKDLDIKIEFIEFSNLDSKLTAMSNGEIDACIGGLSITEEREKIMDFPVPYFNSGLTIMTKNSNAKVNPIKSWTNILTSTNVWLSILFFYTAIFIGGFLLWLTSIGDGGKGIDDKMFPGWMQGSWLSFAIITTIGFGDITPVKWIGRIIATVLGLVGILIFSSITGTISSEMTVQKLDYEIAGVKDLKGKLVAVKRGSTSVDAVKKYGGIPLEISGDDKKDSYLQCFDLLINDNVKAVVADAPVLLWMKENLGNDEVMLVGNIFEEQYYGYAVQKNSWLREYLARSHLKHLGNGKYHEIYKKYFGNKN